MATSRGAYSYAESRQEGLLEPFRYAQPEGLVEATKATLLVHPPHRHPGVMMSFGRLHLSIDGTMDQRHEDING